MWVKKKNFLNLGIGKEFLAMVLKILSMKEKIMDKLDVIKLNIYFVKKIDEKIKFRLEKYL